MSTISAEASTPPATASPAPAYPYASMRDRFDLRAYFVVGPEDTKGRPIGRVVDDALRGGATFIQLRAKHSDASEQTAMARDIAQIIEDEGLSDDVAFVIDDRVDVVWQCRREGIKVDGVHIGQTDMEPRQARALLGDDAIVGLSAETESLVRLINELPAGCLDYIGAGPLHSSATKPEAIAVEDDGSRHLLTLGLVDTIARASDYPVVVGGGVTERDMAGLAATGAAGWFVVSAIAGADDPEAATRRMVEGWKAVRGEKRHGYVRRPAAAALRSAVPPEESVVAQDGGVATESPETASPETGTDADSAGTAGTASATAAAALADDGSAASAASGPRPFTNAKQAKAAGRGLRVGDEVDGDEVRERLRQRSGVMYGADGLRDAFAEGIVRGKTGRFGAAAEAAPVSEASADS